MSDITLPTADIFSLSDRLDEESFLAEMAGHVVREFVYEFSQNGKAVRGLSKAGVDAVCRHLSERNEVIRELELVHDVNLTTREAYFRAKIGRFKIEPQPDGTVREVLLDTAFGTKRQPMTFTTKTGKTLSDPHWYEKGAMKACRNGRRRMIPEGVAVELISKWAGEKGRVRRAQPDSPDAQTPNSPGDPARQRPPSSKKDLQAKAEMIEALRAVKEDLERLTNDPKPPWENPKKIAILKRCFGTGQWPVISKMPAPTFFSHYTPERWKAACVEGIDAPDENAVMGDPADE